MGVRRLNSRPHKTELSGHQPGRSHTHELKKWTQAWDIEFVSHQHKSYHWSHVGIIEGECGHRKKRMMPLKKRRLHVGQEQEYQGEDSKENSALE